MLVEKTHIAVRKLFAEHLFDSLGQQTAVQTDEALLRQLANQSSDILMLNIRVGIEFRTLGGIGCLHIIHHKIQTTLRVAILRVLMAVKHICFSYLIISFSHERNLHLVLNLLNGCVVMNSEMRKDGGECLFRRKCSNC